MKKDMTQNRVVANGVTDYTNGNILHDIEKHLNLIRNCESRDCTTVDREEGKTGGVIINITQEADNIQNNNQVSYTQKYLKMTIKKIINDKMIEMQAFDTGQLKTKLIRMEEENFNLRNRAMALEERIKYLEDRCRAKDIEIDESLAIEEELKIDSGAENDDSMTKLCSSPSNEEEKPISPSSTINFVKIKQEDCTDIETDEGRLEIVEEEITTSSSLSPRTICDSTVTNDISEKKAEQIAPDSSTSSDNEEINSDLTFSSHDLIRPRDSVTPPEVSRKDAPTIASPSHRSREPTKSPPESRQNIPANYQVASSVKPSSLSGGNRPIPSLVPISLYNTYEKRNSMHNREPSNHKVEQYEKQLLGQLSSKSPPNTKRQQIPQNDYAHPPEMDKLLVRTARDYYKLNENIPNSVGGYSPYKQIPHLPQSNGESSLFSNAGARDDLEIRHSLSNNQLKKLQSQNSYRTVDMNMAPRPSRGFAHIEIPNERGIEKGFHPYMNGFSPSQQTRGIPETYKYTDTPNGRYNNPKNPPPSHMDLQRYDSRTLDNFAPLPNSVSKQQLKRHSPGYLIERSDGSYPVEYEPLSKVSPKPPPLIPGHSLSTSSRFPIRNMNIPRDHNMSVPRDHMSSVQKYQHKSQPPPPQSSAAKYNISATNFHATTSRIPNTYQMTKPNYNESSPSNFPSDYDNRLALPQLAAHITSDKSSIIFTWDKINNASHMYMENVDVYFLFAFHTLDLNQPPPKETSYWKRISIVNPLPLPIACTLTQSFDGQNYFFAVAAVNRAGRVGQLSNPCALKVAL